MQRLFRKIILWIIGLAVFVAAYDVVEWFFERGSFNFTFKGNILAPIVSYVIFCIVMFVLRKVGNRENSK